MTVIHTQHYRTNHPAFIFLWTSLCHAFYGVLYRTVCCKIDPLSAGEVIKVHHSLRLHLHRIACRNLHRLLAECYRLSHLSCHDLSVPKFPHNETNTRGTQYQLLSDLSVTFLQHVCRDMPLCAERDRAFQLCYDHLTAVLSCCYVYLSPANLISCYIALLANHLLTALCPRCTIAALPHPAAPSPGLTKSLPYRLTFLPP
jgi:hypothetical protein